MSTSLQHTILVDHIITTSVSVSFSFSVLYKFHSYIKKWTSSSISLWVKNTKNLQATIFITLLQKRTRAESERQRGRDGCKFCLCVCLSPYSTLVCFTKKEQERIPTNSYASTRFNGLAIHRRDSSTLLSRPKCFLCRKTEKVLLCFYSYWILSYIYIIWT